MAPLFEVLDRHIYQHLIPKHLLDLARMPATLLHDLEDGGFVVRQTETEMHGVGLDECHEMKINKDAKMAVVRPTAKKMEHISNYLQFRSDCINNFKEQIFPEKTKSKNSFKQTSKDRFAVNNIRAMREAIDKHGMFSSESENRGLWNFLQNQQATPEQSGDLLNHRQIGQKSYEEYVNTKLLKKPSTHTPKHKKHLCTFSVSKVERKRIKRIERERKLTQRFLKRQLSWIATRGGDTNLDMIFGPISVLPKALVDGNGLPYKSSKSNNTTFLQNRYKNIPVITEGFPESVILEGMFMIQTSPLPTMSFMKDYVKLLVSKYVRPHLQVGVREVHVVFDNPDSPMETPKEIEHRRRDKNIDHKCTTFWSDHAPYPKRLENSFRL